MNCDAIDQLRKRLANLPSAHDERVAELNSIAHAMAEHFREVMDLLPDTPWDPSSFRQSVMVMVGICLDCGRDHGAMVDKRGFFYCSCQEESGG